MNQLISIQCNPLNALENTKKILQELEHGHWVELLHQSEESTNIPTSLLPKDPGVIISSSGSTGGRHFCLHPCSHLSQSAFATAKWLEEQGIEPANCQIFNPLPLNHVSGLMPLWRSHSWGAQHEWVNPALMREPSLLRQSITSNIRSNNKPLLLSLVPIQLKRLLQTNEGIEWLKLFTVIWVGGSFLAENIANNARNKKIRLAPCYGTTETMATVSALTPEDFLKGEFNVGNPLIDIELRLGENRALEIRTPRLAKAIWIKGELKEFQDTNGWWSSGDYAEITLKNHQQVLKINGRIDNAIHSGGETIFPEQLQQRLLQSAKNAKMPIEAIFLASIKHEEWDNRLIALVRLTQNYSPNNLKHIFNDLKSLVQRWLPAEKPLYWYHCQELTQNPQGKWNSEKWLSWTKTQDPIA